ncbi:pyridoxal phosphate-dependent aminotransferase [Candidatus Woesearchaeota archaeon]|nr:pyridoxal phosphate-dependent aminotransferase [Candidatus Woesearchaeota archaeon]
MLAQRVKNIAPSATLAIDAMAKQLKKEGKDVVIFGAGEPDFNTPENIKLAAKKAIDSNFTRYTPVGGIPELRNAVAAKLKRENKLDYDASEVLISCGGKHSLFNIAMAVLDKGDEAILPVPYWVSYEEMIKIAEARPVFCRTDDKFKITSKMVEEKITPRTKMLILNSPSNPSGAIANHDEIRKIAELAIEHNFYVLSDEVYEHFTYGNVKHLSIGSLNEEIKSLTILSNSVSKTYAMTGWRIGYTAGPKEIIKAMDNLQSHSTSNPTSIAQYAALEALNGPQDSVKQMVQAFDERRRFIHKRLNGVSGISCVEPEGAFYAFPDVSETGMSSMEFSSRLLDEALVAVVPGIAFGSDRHVRLSYATSIHEIERGMDRIDRWIKQKAVKIENEEI